MFEGFEELTDRDFYDKAMAGEKPAVVQVGFLVL